MKAGARHRARKRAEFEEALERPLIHGPAFLVSSERRNPHRSTSRAAIGIAVNQRYHCRVHCPGVTGAPARLPGGAYRAAHGDLP
jgi:hypothetical protein